MQGKAVEVGCGGGGWWSSQCTVYQWVITLFQHASGADLSMLLVDTLKKSATPVTEDNLGLYLTLTYNLVSCLDSIVREHDCNNGYGKICVLLQLLTVLHVQLRDGGPVYYGLPLGHGWHSDITMHTMFYMFLDQEVHVYMKYSFKPAREKKFTCETFSKSYWQQD